MTKENREMFSIIGIREESLDLLFNLSTQKPSRKILEKMGTNYEKFIYVDHDMEYAISCNLEKLMSIIDTPS